MNNILIGLCIGLGTAWVMILTVVLLAKFGGPRR